jgi:hypothetical protein
VEEETGAGDHMQGFAAGVGGVGHLQEKAVFDELSDVVADGGFGQLEGVADVLLAAAGVAPYVLEDLPLGVAQQVVIGGGQEGKADLFPGFFVDVDGAYSFEDAGEDGGGGEDLRPTGDVEEDVLFAGCPDLLLHGGGAFDEVEGVDGALQVLEADAATVFVDLSGGLFGFGVVVVEDDGAFDIVSFA